MPDIDIEPHEYRRGIDLDPQDDEPTDWSQMRDWREPKPQLTIGKALLAGVPFVTAMSIIDGNRTDWHIWRLAWAQIVSAFGAS